MPATENLKKKKAQKSPEAKKPREAAASGDGHIQFGTPIETELIKVEFKDLTVTYTLKKTGEVLVKEYDSIHALMIIHGRISHDPHGSYTQQCVAKARIAAMKQIPIS
jgi:hypothetical protein